MPQHPLPKLIAVVIGVVAVFAGGLALAQRQEFDMIFREPLPDADFTAEGGLIGGLTVSGVQPGCVGAASVNAITSSAQSSVAASSISFSQSQGSGAALEISTDSGGSWGSAGGGPYPAGTLIRVRKNGLDYSNFNEINRGTVQVTFADSGDSETLAWSITTSATGQATQLDPASPEIVPAQLFLADGVADSAGASATLDICDDADTISLVTGASCGGPGGDLVSGVEAILTGGGSVGDGDSVSITFTTDGSIGLAGSYSACLESADNGGTVIPNSVVTLTIEPQGDDLPPNLAWGTSAAACGLSQATSVAATNPTAMNWIQSGGAPAARAITAVPVSFPDNSVNPVIERDTGGGNWVTTATISAGDVIRVKLDAVPSTAGIYSGTLAAQYDSDGDGSFESWPASWSFSIEVSDGETSVASGGFVLDKTTFNQGTADSAITGGATLDMCAGSDTITFRLGDAVCGGSPTALPGSGLTATLTVASATRSPGQSIAVNDGDNVTIGFDMTAEAGTAGTYTACLTDGTGALVPGSAVTLDVEQVGDDEPPGPLTWGASACRFAGANLIYADNTHDFDWIKSDALASPRAVTVTKDVSWPDAGIDVVVEKQVGGAGPWVALGAGVSSGDLLRIALNAEPTIEAPYRGTIEVAYDGDGDGTADPAFPVTWDFQIDVTNDPSTVAGGGSFAFTPVSLDQGTAETASTNALSLDMCSDEDEITFAIGDTACGLSGAESLPLGVSVAFNAGAGSYTPGDTATVIDSDGLSVDFAITAAAGTAGTYSACLIDGIGNVIPGTAVEMVVEGTGDDEPPAGLAWGATVCDGSDTANLYATNAHDFVWILSTALAEPRALTLTPDGSWPDAGVTPVAEKQVGGSGPWVPIGAGISSGDSMRIGLSGSIAQKGTYSGTVSVAYDEDGDGTPDTWPVTWTFSIEIETVGGVELAGLPDGSSTVTLPVAPFIQVPSTVNVTTCDGGTANIRVVDEGGYITANDAIMVARQNGGAWQSNAAAGATYPDGEDFNFTVADGDTIDVSIRYLSQTNTELGVPSYEMVYYRDVGDDGDPLNDVEIGRVSLNVDHYAESCHALDTHTVSGGEWIITTSDPDPDFEDNGVTDLGFYYRVAPYVYTDKATYDYTGDDPDAMTGYEIQRSATQAGVPDIDTAFEIWTECERESAGGRLWTMKWVPAGGMSGAEQQNVAFDDVCVPNYSAADIRTSEFCDVFYRGVQFVADIDELKANPDFDFGQPTNELHTFTQDLPVGYNSDFSENCTEYDPLFEETIEGNIGNAGGSYQHVVFQCGY